MAPEIRGYYTKELTKDTLHDFEKLLETHPAPGAYTCWCMHNHALLRGMKLHSSVRNAARNRQQKRKLVEHGNSHGIIVYSKGEPVGWCQYGPKEELPRIDNNPLYRRIAPEVSIKRMWRITCFVVDKKHRKRGVASTALNAALEAIRRKGGGLVEAYPITHWGAYAEYRGTVSMFQKQGFKTIAPLGRSNVVMRKSI